MGKKGVVSRMNCRGWLESRSTFDILKCVKSGPWRPTAPAPENLLEMLNIGPVHPSPAESDLPFFFFFC